MHALGIHIRGDDVHAGLFRRANFPHHRPFPAGSERYLIRLAEYLGPAMMARVIMNVRFTGE